MASARPILFLFLAGSLVLAQTITFRDVAQESGIIVQGGMGSCAAFADYNNDLNLDICFFPGNSVYLYQNNGDLTFTDVTAAAGLAGLNFRSLVWGDYDNDGHLDILANNHGSTLYLLHNNGNGTFTNYAGQVGLTSGGDRPLFLDYDRDGYLDVLIIGMADTRLYRSLATDSFRLILTIPFGGNSGTCSDYNNDLNPDIYICRNGANKLYRNNGDGTFTDVTDSAGVGNTGNTQAAAFGDFDNDGDLDLYITNISAGTNKLYRNNGNNTFTDVTSFYGVADVGDGRTCDWLDYNNDRLLDLFTTNHVNPNRLFRNMGCSAPFFNVAGSVRIASPADVFSASWADYDNDGDLDAFLTGHFGQGCALMQDSGGNALHYLKIQLIGTQSNRAGIGARIQLYRHDTVQTQEVSGGSGQYGHNPSILHFGLGSAGYFDSLKVFWPSGAVSLLGSGSADTLLFITEPAVALTEKNFIPKPANRIFSSPVLAPAIPADALVYNCLGRRISSFYSAGVYYLSIPDQPDKLVKIVKLR